MDSRLAWRLRLRREGFLAADHEGRGRAEVLERAARLLRASSAPAPTNSDGSEAACSGAGHGERVPYALPVPRTPLIAQVFG